VSCGGTVEERAGSRTAVMVGGVRASFNRPHPQPAAKKGVVDAARVFLTNADIQPMTMKYKGYTAGPIGFDPGDSTFSGIVVGPKDVIHFEGTNAAESLASFEAGIDDYLAWCAERGEAPDKPFTGKILVRTAPELHRKAAIRAAAEGVSLSQWISQQIESA
jgi:predicted HicB family RNase H-like nuclease